MSRLFYHVMQDNAGNLLFDVSGTMRIAGSGTLATIYGDEALTVILPNPMTNHPSFGSFKCFLGAGDYDFYMAKSGYTFETLTGVQGHGTMAQQDADAVAITGGDIHLTGTLEVNTFVGIGTPPVTGNRLQINFFKATDVPLAFKPLDTDTGGYTMVFQSVAGALIGSITTTASATAYNTTSDARLKEDVHPLTGALDVVRALRPITHRWRADDSPGVGFLAHEVAEVVDGVISGARDAVDDEGNIVPQMIDYSKLVPFLVGAVQTLAARVASLETQLGV
jgi:hypothetical protein